ncbi:MAG: hypothetical protein JWO38_6965 [Gemmataceae bacterium]|nr:hypothetical protein [Gemmataceae bacterium]
MREQHDHAEQHDQEASEIDDDSPEPEVKIKKTRARKVAAAKPDGEKPPAKPRARKKTVKAPPRLYARWAVCDGGLKRVAVFEYKDRAGADAKLAQLREQKKGTFVLQLVKDPDAPAAVVEPVLAV